MKFTSLGAMALVFSTMASGCESNGATGTTPADASVAMDVAVIPQGDSALPTDVARPRDTGVRMDVPGESPDAGPPVCAPMDIGSMVGRAVARGDSTGTMSGFAGACGGAEAPESAITWTAPSSGVFTFDTEGTDFDTVLYAFNGSCTGTEIACNDDVVENGAKLWSQITLTVSAGQRVTLFVDGYEDQAGPWGLNVTRGAPDGGTASDGGKGTDATTGSDAGSRTDAVASRG